ncbi:MAG: hypothetical protein DIU58_016090 [Sphaerobacter thermophilus]|uniref:hypothetical protein n=1 Tax=Sphaerobacter thermophilus TaxID=2057 RepID=UPI00396EF70A
MTRQRRSDLASGLSPEARAALGDLDPLAARLATYDAPEPDPADTEALIDRLAPLVAARTAPESDLVWDESPAPSIHHWLALARAQIALIDHVVLWAGGLVLALGLIVAGVGYSGLLSLGVTLCAPVLAAAGVAFAFRPAGQTLAEIERISPVMPLELLYVRLGLVLAGNLALALALLGLIWIEGPRLVLWRVVLLWLGPMLGLAGMALYTSARWGTIAGLTVPLGAWGTLVLLAWQGVIEPADPQVFGPTDILVHLSQAPGVLVATLLLLAAGVLLLWQGTRLVGRETAAWN